MTRLAFGLDGWETRDYKGDQALTAEKIADEAATFGNARLWDYRPLGDTLDQLQTVRQYYDFFDLDTDRYHIRRPPPPAPGPPRGRPGRRGPPFLLGRAPDDRFCPRRREAARVRLPAGEPASG